ncbi:MAG: phosphomannomutase/phosphoglucomutase [Candidatus Nealsonbacteria bacterium]
MKINPVIFRAYDIRGIYLDDFNEDFAFKIGQALVKFLRQKKSKIKRKTRLKIVVGQDNRLSSPTLFKSLSKGITNAGADIIDIGLSTTPMFYFAVAFYRFDGGIVITSSHNPPEYNGFKLVREKAIPISGKTGLKRIRTLCATRTLISPKLRTLCATRTLAEKTTVKKKGRIIKKKVLQDYVKFNLREFYINKLYPFKIVVDTANSVSGIIIPSIFKKSPLKIYHLFQELDGSFPNHNPDPLKKENLKSLRKEVLKRKSDLGIAFDGDGDRIVFITERGEIVPGDIVTALIVNIILKGSSGKKVIYDVRSSNIVRETIEKNKGLPLENRIGHSFIKERMRKENVFFAGEFSGHYYSRKHYFCECPFLILFSILKEMSETKKTLSQLIKPFKKYYHSGEINFKVKDKKKILKILEKKFGKKGKILKIDGLKINFPNWWFNFRPSNTEPVLRLVAEAKTKKILEKKKKELISLIKKRS